MTYPTLLGLQRTISYSNLAPVIECPNVFDDRRIKDSFLANEAIVNNFKYHGLDLHEYICRPPVFFNLMTHQKLIEINEQFKLCDPSAIIHNMQDAQWILSFLVKASLVKTDCSVGSIAKKQFIT